MAGKLEMTELSIGRITPTNRNRDDTVTIICTRGAQVLSQESYSVTKSETCTIQCLRSSTNVVHSMGIVDVCYMCCRYPLSGITDTCVTTGSRQWRGGISCLVAIALNLMCTMFFKDVVGAQAQKSVSSARALADRSKSALWSSVAAGLQEQTALRHGNEGSARNFREDGDKLIVKLPQAVKRKFMLGDSCD